MKHYSVHPIHPIKEGYVAVRSWLVHNYAPHQDGCAFCYNHGASKGYVFTETDAGLSRELLCGKAVCPYGYFMVPAELAVQWQFDNADRK